MIKTVKRVISQKGTVSMPYERAALKVVELEDGTAAVVADVSGIPVCMAEYWNKNIADGVMEALAITTGTEIFRFPEIRVV